MLLLEERNRRREANLRSLIQTAKRSRKLTPEVVKAYAALHLQDDQGHPLLAYPHHSLWVDLCCDDSISKLLVIAPPESAKTTWTVGAFVGCRIGFYPEQSIIIGSVAEGVAEKRSLSLRGMVETDGWKATFPDILPVKAGRGLKWDTTEWSIANRGIPTPGRLHPTVTAYGMGGSITGSRGDILLADDLLDFDNTRTQHQREEGEKWFHNSFLPRRKSRVGRVIVIGTAWNPGDIYSKIRLDGSWVVVHTPLLSETEDVYANITYPANWQGRIIGEPVSTLSTSDIKHSTKSKPSVVRKQIEEIMDAIESAVDSAADEVASRVRERA